MLNVKLIHRVRIGMAVNYKFYNVPHHMTNYSCESLKFRTHHVGFLAWSTVPKFISFAGVICNLKCTAL
jgi:hypothetical protein